jgi:hypothetical protein
MTPQSHFRSMKATQEKNDVTNRLGDRDFMLAVWTCFLRKCGRFEVIRDFRSLKNGGIPSPVDGSTIEQKWHHQPIQLCIKCKRVLSYDSTKGGRSHLRRHADSCNAGVSANNPSIANFFKPSGVSNDVKQLITEKCVQFVCRDIRPFQTMAGDGFQALADALTMTGVKYGQASASEILPNPTTISRNIEAKYAEINENIVQFPKLALLARNVLCISATSASSERAFSAAGSTVAERRTRLIPDTVIFSFWE